MEVKEELDCITLGGVKVIHDILSVTHNEGICAGTPDQGVQSRTANQAIIPGTAIQIVIPASTIQKVGPGITMQMISVVRAGDILNVPERVLVVLPSDRSLNGLALCQVDMDANGGKGVTHPVIPGTSVKGVVAGTSVKGVVAGTSVKVIIPATSPKMIRIVIPDECVVENASPDMFDIPEMMIGYMGTGKRVIYPGKVLAKISRNTMFRIRIVGYGLSIQAGGIVF